MGPVDLKVLVPVTGAAFAGYHRPNAVHLSFPTLTNDSGLSKRVMFRQLAV